MPRYFSSKIARTLAACLLAGTTLAHASDRRPNIIMIVADDMGYTDIGVTGSEIATPNLDSLANSGTFMSNFYVAPMCAPTRGMMMTGVDSHLTGLATMNELGEAPNWKGKPGYVGHLNKNVVTAASLLKDGGYHTYMAGKWHLGFDDDQSPRARGFERSLALLEGGGSHFSRKGFRINDPVLDYREDGKIVDDLPEDFFSTRAYTDKIIKSIDADHGDGKPFFAFVSYTAPHWPLQVEEEWLNTYKGKYDDGYEVLRDKRIANMKKLGLFPAEAKTLPFSPFRAHKPWAKLNDKQKKHAARVQEIYSAMVDNMDHHIGRLVYHLKQIGEYDNTMIVFFSDNGPHGGDAAKGLWRWYMNKDEIAEWKKTYDFSYENMGRKNSILSHGPWAQASAGPERLFKTYTTQGGIHSPLIIKYPGGVKNKRNDSFAHVMDIPATFLDAANVKHPGTEYKGRKVHPIQGKSLLAVVKGEAEATHDANHIAGWELIGRKAVRKGDWKIVFINNGPFKTAKWQLFNLAKDPAETTDLAESEPEILNEMVARWGEYHKANNLIDPEWPANTPRKSLRPKKKKQS